MLLCKFDHKRLSQVEVVFMGDLYEMVAVELVLILVLRIVPFGSEIYLTIIKAQKRFIHPVLCRAYIKEGVMNLVESGHIIHRSFEYPYLLTLFSSSAFLISSSISLFLV